MLDSDNSFVTYSSTSDRFLCVVPQFRITHSDERRTLYVTFF